MQGPDAFALVADVLDVDPTTLSFGQHTVTHRGEVPVVVCRTGYTGERGVELVLPVAVAGEVWDELVAGGAERCGFSTSRTRNHLTADDRPAQAWR